jgi:hypothetical protein
MTNIIETDEEFKITQKHYQKQIGSIFFTKNLDLFKERVEKYNLKLHLNKNKAIFESIDYIKLDVFKYFLTFDKVKKNIDYNVLLKKAIKSSNFDVVKHIIKLNIIPKNEIQFYLGYSMGFFNRSVNIFKYILKNMNEVSEKEELYLFEIACQRYNLGFLKILNRNKLFSIKKNEKALLEYTHQYLYEAFSYICKQKDIDLFIDNEKYFKYALRNKNLEDIKLFYKSKFIKYSLFAKTNALSYYMEKNNSKYEDVRFLLKNEFTCLKDKKNAFANQRFNNSFFLKEENKKIFNLFLRQKDVDFFAKNNIALTNFTKDHNKYFIKKMLSIKSDFEFQPNLALIESYKHYNITIHPEIFDLLLLDGRNDFGFNKGQLFNMMLKRNDLSLFRKILSNKQFDNYLSFNLLLTAFENKKFGFVFEIIKIKNIKDILQETMYDSLRLKINQELTKYKIKTNIKSF